MLYFFAAAVVVATRRRLRRRRLSRGRRCSETVCLLIQRYIEHFSYSHGSRSVWPGRARLINLRGDDWFFLCTLIYVCTNVYSTTSLRLGGIAAAICLDKENICILIARAAQVQPFCTVVVGINSMLELTCVTNDTSRLTTESKHYRLGRSRALQWRGGSFRRIVTKVSELYRCELRTTTRCTHFVVVVLPACQKNNWVRKVNFDRNGEKCPGRSP